MDMSSTTINYSGRMIEPFNHDCENCKWVGWAYFGGNPVNVYICRGETVVIRFSSIPGDYWSSSVGNSPGPLGYSNPDHFLSDVAKLKEREAWEEESEND